MKNKVIIGLLGVAILAFLIINSNILIAADNSTNTSSNDSNSVNSSLQTSSTSTVTSTGTADSSYQCLTNKIGNRTDLSLQEAVFSTLALGSKDNLVTVINNNKNTNENCWPKSGCTLKDTALVVLAYNRIGKDTSGIISWLKSKNGTSNDLAWYLEVDTTNHSAGTCTVGYDNAQGNVKIDQNMQVSITGAASSCLSSSGYWLRINAACVDKQFKVSCNDDFISTIVYQKTGSDTVYISSDTHSSASGGTTQETVSAKCFKQNGQCNYEGSLWAAWGLQKTGNDITAYVPYLMAAAEDNQQYFPSSFLYLIAGGTEQYSQVIQNQKQNEYWEVSAGNRFYDTSLGMLALSGSGANELENTRNYLLGIKTTDGCWNNNNIRDTAFLLYSGWPKTVAAAQGSSPSCTSAGKFCSGSFECTNAGGIVQYSYDCPGVSTCCSLNPLTQSCSALSGKVCNSDQRCTGDSSPSVDGSCCLGTCQAIQQNTCEQVSGRFCRTQCGSGESQISETCDSGSICCEVGSSNTSTGTSHTWIWILLLGILILIIILAILFRDKIKLWWYKQKGKTSSGPVRSGPRPGVGPRPGPPGTPIGMRPMQRPMFRPAQPMRRPTPPAQQPVRKPIATKDNEMEDTLKKLREMSK